MPADEMAKQLGGTLPRQRQFETVAGLVIAEPQHMPETGEAVETLGWRSKVVGIDGPRIDKVLAMRLSVEADRSSVITEKRT
jgi:putative hemolysin